jgi:membrane protein YqaA with SNARE-associated domain
LNYGIGYLGKPEWLAKIRVSQDQILRWKDRVKRYGVWLALGTWLPFVGDVIAVALGFFKTAWKPTFFFIFIGKFARYLLILLFYLYVQ